MSKNKSKNEFYFNKATRCPECGSFDCRMKWNSKLIKCNACNYEEI